MATVIQRLYPTAHYCDFNRGQGVGTHTAAGVWTITNSVDCATYCDDLYGSLDETNYGRAISMGGTGYVNNGQFEWTFGDPPVNVTITNLTLVAYMRTSSGNSAAIDSTPTVEFFVDPGTGTRDYAGATDSVNAPCNRNTQAATGTFIRVTRSWASKPGGGAWTRSELLSGSFKAGIASDGTHGSGIDKTTGGSSSSFDVAAFWVELETTPGALFIEPVRMLLSHQLRLLSRASRTLTIDVPPEFEDVTPGETIWASHTLLPWEPGYKDWEQVPLYVIGVGDALDPPRLTLTCLDLREIYATYYSPLRILGVDEQNSGLARLDQGGGWSTSRDQVAYAERPGDALLQQVAADSPLLTSNGLLIQGGSTGGTAQDINHALNSTFSAGSSNTFTAWTKTVSGSATIIEDLEDYLIDTSGLQRSAHLTTTTSSENCYVSQAVASVSSGTDFWFRGWFKNDAGDGFFSYQLQRSADNYYWDNVGNAWTTAQTDNAITVASTMGEFVSDHISLGSTTTTVTTRIGYFAAAAASTGGSEGHLYSLELLSGGSTYHRLRTPLVSTTSGSITRVADITAIDNSEDFNVWYPSRGYFYCEVRPNWSQSFLIDDEVKPVLCSSFNSTGGATENLIVAYKRLSSTTGKWYFDGAEIAASSAAGAPDPPTAKFWYKMAGRWTSVASDEFGLGGQAVDFWISDPFGNVYQATTYTGRTEATQTNTSLVWLGYDGTNWLDGWIRNLVLSNHCPTDTEIERLVARG